MNEIHLLPTKPTTDATSYAVALAHTSNHAYDGFLKQSPATPSGWSDVRVQQSVADHELLQQLYSPSANQASSRTENVWIDNLGEAGYHILQPMPVEIRRVEPGDFLATFREANIAMSGSDSDDAFQALVAEILETFDVLISERSLGPDASEQRRILSTYIVRT